MKDEREKREMKVYFRRGKIGAIVYIATPPQPLPDAERGF
jgi:hypothetical protein